jgi:hypothetical protein
MALDPVSQKPYRLDYYGTLHQKNANDNRGSRRQNL